MCWRALVALTPALIAKQRKLLLWQATWIVRQVFFFNTWMKDFEL